MEYNPPGSGDLDAVKNDGTTAPNAVGVGCTLGVGTYFFPLGSQLSPLPSQTSIVSVHLAWSAAVAATITFETSDFPSKLGGQDNGGPDVKDYDTTGGNWIQQNPSSAYVPVAGSGNSATSATVTAGGTNAGGCEFIVSNLGSRRARVKVVTTVGGTVRCCRHGKLGA